MTPMCMFSTPEPPPVTVPPEPAQMREPDSGAVKSATGRRTADRLRSGSNTILTSGSGVLDTAGTGKKTLLGQ
jgi:hypothetical protein